MIKFSEDKDVQELEIFDEEDENDFITDIADYMVCEYCESSEDVTSGPDPFASEVYGDYTPKYLCALCRHESAMDV